MSTSARVASCPEAVALCVRAASRCLRRSSNSRRRRRQSSQSRWQRWSASGCAPLWRRTPLPSTSPAFWVLDFSLLGFALKAPLEPLHLAHSADAHLPANPAPRTTSSSQVEMQVKEKERAAVAAQRKRESARQAQEKREAFEKRIARARERAAEAEAEKRREFELRELAAQARSDALAAAKEEEAALRAQIEEEREAQRAAVSAEAAAAAELRINALLEKQLKFEEREKHLQAQREQETVERARRAEQAEEERKLKLEHLMRWREEETAKLEVKIDEAAQRTIALNEQKRQLVMARKVSSVRAQLARQNMKEEMEQARRKRWAAAHPGSPFDLARKAQNRPFGVKSAPNSPRVRAVSALAHD